MIPAKTSCPSGWGKEYAGCLMTNYRGTGRGRTTFECIDKNAEAIPGLAADINNSYMSSLFYTMSRLAAMACHVLHMIHRKI